MCTVPPYANSANHVNNILHFVIRYLPKVFARYGGADGFLFLQDHMILNYWNLLQADKGKLWITDKVCISYPIPSIHIFLFLIMYVLSINAHYTLGLTLLPHVADCTFLGYYSTGEQ